MIPLLFRSDICVSLRLPGGDRRQDLNASVGARWAGLENGAFAAEPLNRPVREPQSDAEPVFGWRLGVVDLCLRDAGRVSSDSDEN